MTSVQNMSEQQELEASLLWGLNVEHVLSVTI